MTWKIRFCIFQFLLFGPPFYISVPWGVVPMHFCHELVGEPANGATDDSPSRYWPHHRKRRCPTVCSDNYLPVFYVMLLTVARLSVICLVDYEYMTASLH